VARLRAVVEAKDAENAALRAALAGLRAELEAERELRRRLELRVAELERCLGMDSTDSGTPTSREPIGARERRRAERRSWQVSERERRKDRKRGGQPGHAGSGLRRDLDPGERNSADPPAQCSRCGPAERAANLIRMLAGIPVSPGFIDRASQRLAQRLGDAGFDEAMAAALSTERALGAHETPVNVLTPDADPGTGQQETGSPHILIIRLTGGKLTWLRALGSRRHAAITAILSFFTGITDGYGAYQDLLPQLAGIQQCCQHVIRRCRAVTKLDRAACSPGPPTSSRSSARRTAWPPPSYAAASRANFRSCWRFDGPDPPEGSGPSRICLFVQVDA
jgi:hypothetical protein